MPVREDALHDLPGHARGNGEADPLVAAAARQDGGVDADHLAACVDQRAARVAGVDRGVGLDEVLVIGQPQASAADGADDPHGHGLADPEGVADRQHDVADLQVLGVAQDRRRQRGVVDTQNGEVGALIRAQDAGSHLAPVGERDLDLARVLDDVVVRQDRPAIVDHDPRAQAEGAPLAGHRELLGVVSEELPEEGVGEERRIALVGLDHLHGGDVHDRGHDGADDRGVAVLGRSRGRSWRGDRRRSGAPGARFAPRRRVAAPLVQREEARSQRHPGDQHQERPHLPGALEREAAHARPPSLMHGLHLLARGASLHARRKGCNYTLRCARLRDRPRP